MESICKFDNKSSYELYPNEVDILAHVYEGALDKVYLRLGRKFSFLIHAQYEVTRKKNVNVIGSYNSDNNGLKYTALLKVTNNNTGEIRLVYPSLYINLEPGSYTIDYGIYMNPDETYSTPDWLFYNCPELIYILVDPEVTKFNHKFCSSCSNLTGIMFGDPGQYPSEKVFDEDYSENDVIINNHMTMTENGRRFLAACPKIRNIYIGDEVTGFVGCFGENDGCNYGVPDTNIDPNSQSAVFTQVYLGKNVSKSIGFRDTNKITKYIVSDLNELIYYDELIKAIIDKKLVWDNSACRKVDISSITDDINNPKYKKIIITGITYYPDGYLKIPSNYKMNDSYRTYVGLDSVKVLDLFEYEAKTGTNTLYFEGFRDLNNIETLILPKNVNRTRIYVGGFAKVKNLIVPTRLAPIQEWEGGGSSRNLIYGGTWVTVTNCGGNLSNAVLKNGETPNLYVINGNEDERLSWNEQYDRTNYSDWQSEGINKRPNVWCDFQKTFGDSDAPVPTSSGWTQYNSPYKSFILNYKDEYGNNGIRALINTFIPDGYNKLPTEATT